MPGATVAPASPHARRWGWLPPRTTHTMPRPHWPVLDRLDRAAAEWLGMAGHGRRWPPPGCWRGRSRPTGRPSGSLRNAGSRMTRKEPIILGPRQRRGHPAGPRPAALQRCRQLTGEIVAFDHELKRLVATLTPALLVLVGCASLTAAKLLGETAAVDRFRSKRAYARYSGTTPPPVWTGNRLRHRLSRPPPGRPEVQQPVRT
jgi:hypothetical protein